LLLLEPSNRRCFYTFNEHIRRTGNAHANRQMPLTLVVMGMATTTTTTTTQ